MESLSKTHILEVTKTLAKKEIKKPKTKAKPATKKLVKAKAKPAPKSKKEKPNIKTEKIQLTQSV